MQPTVLSILQRRQELTRRGEQVSVEDLCRDAPQLVDEIRRRISLLGSLEKLFRQWKEAHRRGCPLSPEELCRDQPALVVPLSKQVAAWEAKQRANPETDRMFPIGGDAKASTAGIEVLPGFTLVAQVGMGAGSAVGLTDPYLQPLPEIERTVVARALAEAAPDRWPDCCSLVNASMTGPATPSVPPPAPSFPAPDAVPLPKAPARNRLQRWLVGGAVALLSVQLSVAMIQLRHGPSLSEASSSNAATRPSSSSGPTSQSIPPGIVGEIRCLRGHGGPITCVALSPNGRLAASGDSEGVIHLWDLTNGTDLGSPGKHTAAVQALAFARNGSWLVSAGLDMAVRFWDAGARPPTPLSSHQMMEPGGFSELVVSSDGRFLLARCAAGPVYFWDIESGRLLQRSDGQKRLTAGVCFTSDGTPAMLLSGCRTVFRSVWAKETRRRDAEGAVEEMQVRIPLVTAFEEVVDADPLSLWNVRTNQPIQRFGTAQGAGRAVFSPDGHTLLLWNDKLAQSFDVKTNRIVWSRPTPWPATWQGAMSAGGGRVILWPELPPSSEPAGDIPGAAANESWEGLFLLWSLESGLVRRFDGHRGAIASVIFSPDGHFALSAGMDHTLRYWMLPEK